MTNEAKLLAQDIASGARPMRIFITDLSFFNWLPRDWDDTLEGALSYEHATAVEIKNALTTVGVMPVSAMRDMGKANRATVELGIPVLVTNVEPDFRYGDIWLQVVGEGYLVVTRTK